MCLVDFLSLLLETSNQSTLFIEKSPFLLDISKSLFDVIDFDQITFDQIDFDQIDFDQFNFDQFRCRPDLLSII
ncbi:MAG: hypothetical protein EBX19_05465 [Actinobacteria bacterium]|nr:hypothetical protein [Actinomycetota bacterium]